MKRKSELSGNDNRFKKLIWRYLSNLPAYMLPSGIAFTVDIITYTLLRSIIGINLSAFFAFVLGSTTLYIALRLTRAPKLSKKRYAVIIQILIGLGSLTINLIILNLIQYLVSLNSAFLELSREEWSYLFTITAKLLASASGFLWTSSVTMKSLFHMQTPRISSSKIT